VAHLLIVDDEPMIRGTLGQFLTRAGHDVAAAADVASAFRHLEGTTFDVVLSDIVMPGPDGLELLRRVRERTPETKVILLTGEPSVDTASKALRAGAFDYLAKPVARAQLIATVERALAFKTLEDENRRYREGLEQQVLARTKKLNDLLEQVVAALTRAMEGRDPYTAGHQRRVADLSVVMARRLGLDPKTSRVVRLAALLHDIGKLQIPAETLAKPTRLSPVELELIKTHARAGFEILQGVDFDEPVAEIVLQHHERIDGSGYPRGLTGDQVRIEARILAVADSVEAMASHRPYRAALGLDKALQSLLRDRDVTYDAACVDACVAAIGAGEWKA